MADRSAVRQRFASGASTVRRADSGAAPDSTCAVRADRTGQRHRPAWAGATRRPVDRCSGSAPAPARRPIPAGKSGAGGADRPYAHPRHRRPHLRADQRAHRRPRRVDQRRCRRRLSIELRLRFLREDLPQLVDLAAEILREPAFPSTEVDKVRHEILAAIKEQDDDTRSVADRTVRELIYPGRPSTPRPRARRRRNRSQALTTDDLRAFHRRWFGPRNLTVAAVGGCQISRRSIAASSIARFGDWTSAAAPPDLDLSTTAARGGATDEKSRSPARSRPTSRSDSRSFRASIRRLPGVRHGQPDSRPARVDGAAWRQRPRQAGTRLLRLQQRRTGSRRQPLDRPCGRRPAECRRARSRACATSSTDLRSEPVTDRGARRRQALSDRRAAARAGDRTTASPGCCSASSTSAWAWTTSIAIRP